MLEDLGEDSGEGQMGWERIQQGGLWEVPSGILLAAEDPPWGRFLGREGLGW